MTSEKMTAVPFEEIELKLCLPCADPSILEPQLAGLPLLAHCRAKREHLHNIYFDTPDDLLNRQRTALRLRRVGSAKRPVWLQTLKMGGTGDSALSQRGEWETQVPNAALEFGMLEATPWAQLDPDGSLMHSLTPRFTTEFTRTSWTIRNLDDASVVEVAFDRGQIVANGHSASICELELELKAGEPAALFAIARQIATTLAVMPLAASKAQRGFSLANHTLDQPARARPLTLSPDMALSEAARCVLRDVLNHFSANLHILLTSDDPEVVHQARIAARRMKAALSVFKKIPWVQDAPSLQALKPLLIGLGRLRDLEVASLQTLPMLANAYVGTSSRRKGHWHALQVTLTQTAADQLQWVRDALHNPGAGSTLLALTEWLESDTAGEHSAGLKRENKAALKPWVRQRMERLRDQIKRTLKKTPNAANLHRARLLAKRLRYSVEAFRSVLPKRRAQRWHRQAAHLQSTIGSGRDLQQALAIARRLKAHSSLLKFLNVVSLGQNHAR
jgi:inorganic triphosphatase YgiF